MGRTYAKGLSRAGGQAGAEELCSFGPQQHSDPRAPQPGPYLLLQSHLLPTDVTPGEMEPGLLHD